MIKPVDLDAELAHWHELQDRHDFSGLLLGNGASQAIWKNFAYDSLFDLAQTTRNKPLSISEMSVFRVLDTHNFEPVLSALKTAMQVNAALTISSASPRNRYFAIKEALIHGIRSAHIPWKLMQESTLIQLNQAFKSYRNLYSTNYDLLAYWAVMHDPLPFDDMFDEDSGFTPRPATAEKTRLLYLHGGMHLVKNIDGTTRKLPSSGSTLLGSFAINALDDVPTFINEGRSEEKLKIIRHSEYLSYCHGQLAAHQGALCIFGQALGAQDQHIVAAIRQARPNVLAISIYPRSAAFIQHQKKHYRDLFAGMETGLLFFDAKTHPLGNPDLNVPVERLKLH